MLQQEPIRELINYIMDCRIVSRQLLIFTREAKNPLVHTGLPSNFTKEHLLKPF